MSSADHLGKLGNEYYRCGDLARAQDYHQQALDISREIRDRRQEASQLANLGLLAAHRGRTKEACRLVGEAAAIYEDIGAGGEGRDIVRWTLQELGCE